MNILLYEVSTRNTSSCVELLNNNYKVANWKRVAKFNLKLFDTSQVRVFSDGIEEITLISKISYQDEYTIMCKNLNLYQLKPLIDQINVISKNYHTFDYGQIFFNPYSLDLLIVGGDSGIVYSKLSSKKLSELIAQGEIDFESINDVDLTTLIPSLKSVKFEAELLPEEDGSEGDWIEIGSINVLDL